MVTRKQLEDETDALLKRVYDEIRELNAIADRSKEFIRRMNERDNSRISPPKPRLGNNDIHHFGKLG